MRGSDTQQSAMFSYLSPEQRVPANHPLRRVREITDRLLDELWDLFDRMYSTMGRPSIAPEKLLRALLLQVLYTIRSERLLMEQLDYNLPFAGSSAWRWTIRSGTRPSSPRTGSGCSRGRSRAHSSTVSWPRRARVE